MRNKTLRLATLASMLLMFATSALAEEASEGALIIVEGYGDGPLEFVIGEAAAITIRYDEAIDPARVKVWMNGRAKPRLLNPVSGGTEMVPLYLENGENRLVVEASSVGHPQGQGPEARFEYRFLEILKPRYGTPSDGESFF